MKNPYIHIRRHGILLFFMTSRFLMSLIPFGLLLWIFYTYEAILPSEFSNYIILPTLIVGINYIFLRLMLNCIDYFGRVVLIADHAIILIHTSFLLIDDIEFMDMKSVLKVDVERHGLVSNIFNYGHLILEQRNDVRRIHYIPFPHAVYQIIKNKIPQKNEESKT